MFVRQQKPKHYHCPTTVQKCDSRATVVSKALKRRRPSPDCHIFVQSWVCTKFAHFADNGNVLAFVGVQTHDCHFYFSLLVAADSMKTVSFLSGYRPRTVATTVFAGYRFPPICRMRQAALLSCWERVIFL